MTAIDAISKFGDPCYECGAQSLHDDESGHFWCSRCGVGVDQDGQVVLPDGTVGFN